MVITGKIEIETTTRYVIKNLQKLYSPCVGVFVEDVYTGLSG